MHAPLAPRDESVRLALAVRPDLAAYRMGAQSAQAHLVRAEAAAPQDGRIGSKPSVQAENRATEPIVSREDGQVWRARINVQQTGLQIAATERAIASEVERAHLDCELSAHELLASGQKTIAEAARRRDAAERNYLSAGQPVQPGTDRLNLLLLEWSECEKLEHRHAAILERYLASALELNTAVGARILP